MARRNATEAPVEETTEAPVEETTEATTDTNTESTENSSTAAEAPAEEKVADLTDFKAATEAALTEADSSTGDLPKTALDGVNKAYREIDGVKGKNAARAWLDEQMKASIVGKDIMKAKAFVLIKDGLTAAGGSSTPKPPADPTQAFVQKVAALTIAHQLLTLDVPEGVAEDWTAKVEALTEEITPQIDAYRTFLNSEDEDAEQPEVSPVVRQAFKLAAGKAPSGTSASRVTGGPRRDIVKHIEQVFADKESGAFLTVNEIAKAQSTEYGDDRPSAGAVSARLFPKGREPFANDTFKASAEEGQPRGAVKL